MTTTEYKQLSAQIREKLHLPVMTLSWLANTEDSNEAKTYLAKSIRDLFEIVEILKTKEKD